MLLASHAGILATGTGSSPFIPTSCAGKCSSEPAAKGPATRSLEPLSGEESEQALAEFVRRFVGPAYGIDKAQLEPKDGRQRIVAFVYDWNGILNMPPIYHGLEVAFTQFIPTGAICLL